MEEKEYCQLFSDAFQLNGLSGLLTAERVNQTVRFIDYLTEENQKYNLTAICDPTSIVYKHFVDSLLASNLFSGNASVIDIGCGGGFPTVPLAIFRPDLHITAIDSTEKKIRFIDAASRIAGFSVTAISGRAEVLATSDMREKADIVTSRAVASLPILVELCLPFVRLGGSLIAMKGPDLSRELKEAKNAIKILGGNIEDIQSASLRLPHGATEQRNLLVVRKISSTPLQYPRAFGQIKKKHL